MNEMLDDASYVLTGRYCFEVAEDIQRINAIHFSSTESKYYRQSHQSKFETAEYLVN